MALALLFGLFFSYMYYKNLKRVHNKIIVKWGIFWKESCMIAYFSSLRKQLTLGDATVGLPVNWRMRNKCINPIYGDNASLPRSVYCFWLNEANFQPIRNTTQIWVVRVISTEFLRMFLRRHFKGETAGSYNFKALQLNRKNYGVSWKLWREYSFWK